MSNTITISSYTSRKGIALEYVDCVCQGTTSRMEASCKKTNKSTKYVIKLITIISFILLITIKNKMKKSKVVHLLLLLLINPPLLMKRLLGTLIVK